MVVLYWELPQGLVTALQVRAGKEVRSHRALAPREGIRLVNHCLHCQGLSLNRFLSSWAQRQWFGNLWAFSCFF